MSAPDVAELAISVAVAIADAPLVELEEQSAYLAELTLDGFLTLQDAADIARTAGVAAGLVYRHGEDVVQEAIAWGFERAEHIESPTLAPAPPPRSEPESSRPAQSTIDAFLWTATFARDQLPDWLDRHRQDADALLAIWKTRTTVQS